MTFWYTAGALLLIYIFIPRFGALALYRNWRAARQREQVEDALKHLLDREQAGRHASSASLAGTSTCGALKRQLSSLRWNLRDWLSRVAPNCT